MTRLLYLDCTAGISGDMLLGALVDLGYPIRALADIARGLGVEARIHAKDVTRAGLRATQVVIEDGRPRQGRSALELIDLVSAASTVSPTVRDRARAALERLAIMESEIHGVPVADAHLHELSGADTLIDVVGTFAALEALGVREIHSSPVNLGGGSLRGRPSFVPAPATAALLREAPVYGTDGAGESTTPTGALLLTSVVTSWGALPRIRIDRIGLGAGSRDLPTPNVLRCFLGAADDVMHAQWRTELVSVLETNIDDLQPQLYEHLTRRLFAEGAVDVTVTPTLAKHGRPGVLVQVIAPGDRERALVAILFRESTTLGVRRRTTERFALERRSETRATSFGPIEVKVARLPDGSERVSPEYRDLARVAEASGMSVIEVTRKVAREI